MGKVSIGCFKHTRIRIHVCCYTTPTYLHVCTLLDVYRLLNEAHMHEYLIWVIQKHTSNEILNNGQIIVTSESAGRHKIKYRDANAKVHDVCEACSLVYKEGFEGKLAPCLILLSDTLCNCNAFFILRILAVLYRTPPWITVSTSLYFSLVNPDPSAASTISPAAMGSGNSKPTEHVFYGYVCISNYLK